MTTPGSRPAGRRRPAEPPLTGSPGKDRTGVERTPAAAGRTGPGAAPAFDRCEEGPAVPALSDWPFQSYLELGALPSAVPCARLHARQVLWEWGLHALTDTAELIVSELVTNAITASQDLTGSWYAGHWTPGAPPLRLWLHGDPQRITIQVWDGNDQLPTRHATELAAECGRGLLLVEALSEAWGSYRPRESTGKVVWAVTTGTP
jgi:anti-sigma regulatory factor (Ser/Thr protein kinase)